MMEPMFGSAPPLWNSVPPSPPWTLVTPQSGQIAHAAIPIPAPSQIRMSPDAFGYGAGAVPLPGAIGPAGSYPAFGTMELLAPTTALVAAVATRRGQPNGPANDAEIEDFLNDALDLVPGTLEVEVRCEGSKVMLTGTVPHKRHKRDIGEIAWALPIVTDVENTLTIVARRRARASVRSREGDAAPVRKHA